MKMDSHSRLAQAARFTLVAGVLIAGVALITNQVVSQDKGAPPGQSGQPTAEQMAEMMEAMKKWQSVAAPGEQHKHLERFTGTWDLTIKMWMGGPEGPASESKGTSTVRWILDKRFLLEEVEAEMDMGPLGKQAFKGLGLAGYDNFKKMYVGTWADNMGTQLLSMRGTRHPKTGVFTYYGEMDEPMLDVQDRMVKHVTRVVDADTHVFEMYDLAAGDDYKVMEITYTRRK